MVGQSLSLFQLPKRAFRLNAAQSSGQDVMASGARHILGVGGSRSGKTTLFVHACVIRALKAEGSRHAILRQHANAARGSIALDTLPKVVKIAFPGRKATWHSQDGYFSFSNGSEIWIGGLDDKERVEKILGKEYATIYLNECSQIPYASVLVVLTRLAQVVSNLRQVAYYDLNPVGKGHWTNLQFGEKRDPVTRKPLQNPNDYARFFINPPDNSENLSADYLRSLETMPERQRKRFFEGVYVDEIEGALWTYEAIERSRVDPIEGTQAGDPGAYPLEKLRRIVVAVDPSGAGSKEDESSDEIGIVVVGIGEDGHAYVLADRSLRDSPAAWGRAAVTAYHQFKADRIIAEQNFGGEMVRFVIKTADPNVPVHVISASRGKAVRAEPVSGLYNGTPARVHHVGRFGLLEDQLCAFTSGGYRGEDSPDHADALVWAITDLMLDQPTGWGILEFARQSAGAVIEQQKPKAQASVKLKPPSGISMIYGVSGKTYRVNADGVFEVAHDDAKALLAQGFVEIG